MNSYTIYNYSNNIYGDLHNNEKLKKIFELLDKNNYKNLITEFTIKYCQDNNKKYDKYNIIINNNIITIHDYFITKFNLLSFVKHKNVKIIVYKDNNIFSLNSLLFIGYFIKNTSKFLIEIIKYCNNNIKFKNYSFHISKVIDIHNSFFKQTISKKINKLNVNYRIEKNIKKIILII